MISVVRVAQGVECGNILLSYKSMHQDLRAAMDWVHMKVRMTSKTCQLPWQWDLANIITRACFYTLDTVCILRQVGFPS